MATPGPDLPDGTLLRVAHLTKRYGALTALQDVSFAIRRGEVLGLIGPNGSGKTTLFECLGGTLAFDEGRIERPASVAEPLFYLPDGISPWPAQPVRWALRFIEGYFGAGPGRRESVIRVLDLEPLLDQAIGHLSKGQRKRVLLGLGLLTPHPLLLADEPFEGLDLRQTREVANALRAFAASGRTLLLSIHQIPDAARVCDRFVLLSGGRVRGEGTREELLALASSRGGHAVGDLEEAFLALT